MASSKWPEQTNWKVTLSRDCSNCVELEAEVESLREQNKALEENIEEKRNECMNLRQQLAAKDEALQLALASAEQLFKLSQQLKKQLAETHRLWQESCNDAFKKSKQLASNKELIDQMAMTIRNHQDSLDQKDATICGMREAIQLALECWYLIKPDARIELERVLTSSPICPHKEEVESLKEDNKYKEELGLKVRGLRYTCSNLSRDKDDLQAELVTAKEEVERLKAELLVREPTIGIIWLHQSELNDLQAELASLQKVARTATHYVSLVLSQHGDLHGCGLDRLRDALASYESKWGKVRHP